MTMIADAPPAHDLRPNARGPVSERLIQVLSGSPGEVAAWADLARAAARTSPDAVRDDDLQLTLFLLYGLHYGPAEWVRGEWEWHPELLSGRGALEERFERDLRAQVPVPDEQPGAAGIPDLLFRMTGVQSGPSLSRHLAKKATREQAVESLIQRSIYTLKEADPHSWAIPRLSGRAKVALVEIQSDEYGAGRPARMHQSIFARAMDAAGLDSRYGAYVDVVPALTLASLNLMSLFGLHRRLRGAIVGHLAAYEMTSSIPCRKYADGFRRLGFAEEVVDYFEEHVEADAVHEQIAGRDLAGGLAEDDPETIPDIVFGAAACLHVDGLVGEHMLAAWERGESSLRTPA